MSKDTKTKILIADDHSIVRMGLSALLSYMPEFEVVGEAEDGEEAVRKTLELHPDVVIMDLVMPKMDGAESTRAICEKLPGTKVLILTTFGTSADVARAVAAGASGALMKDISNGEFLSALNAVVRGERVFSQEIAQTVKEESDIPNFTQRQMEILHSVTRGLTNAEIATQLNISTDGVKRHVMAIFKKLGAANRSEAVAIALRRQLLKV